MYVWRYDSGDPRSVLLSNLLPTIVPDGGTLERGAVPPYVVRDMNCVGNPNALQFLALYE